jgi:purine-binding chemotaxis protein CheW
MDQNQQTTQADQQTDIAVQDEPKDRSGKYLTFCLDNEEYGLEILQVREIIGMMSITQVPRTPEFIKGVINLRGKVIPVIDLRLKFSMPEAEWTEETCIIVVNVGDVEVGIIVDRVWEVRDILGKEIDDPPSFGTNVDSSFILGMGKAEERVTILLDIHRVLGQDEDALADIIGG